MENIREVQMNKKQLRQELTRLESLTRKTNLKISDLIRELDKEEDK